MKEAPRVRWMPVSGKDGLRRALFEIKTIVARYPALALPIARRRHGVPVGPDTEIVIEGFPRSGTSFAVAAFGLAQDRPVRVACHVHAPAQVVSGVRRSLPTLVITREPEATVLSFVIRNPHISMAQALRGYLRFYAPLLPYRRGFVVGLFGDVTSDFGAVIRRVNERFHTGFREFEHSEENVRICFEAIDEDYGRRLPPGPALERAVARPSELRDALKRSVQEGYRAVTLAGLRRRAEATYEALASPDDATHR